MKRFKTEPILTIRTAIQRNLKFQIKITQYKNKISKNAQKEGRELEQNKHLKNFNICC